MLSEVAIISTEYGRNGFPRQLVLKQLQDNRSNVLITGDCLNGRSNYADAKETDADDAFTAPPGAIFNEQGNVTVLVLPGGDHHTIYGRAFPGRSAPAIPTTNGRPDLRKVGK